MESGQPDKVTVALKEEYKGAAPLVVGETLRYLMPAKARSRAGARTAVQEELDKFFEQVFQSNPDAFDKTQTVSKQSLQEIESGLKIVGHEAQRLLLHFSTHHTTLVAGKKETINLTHTRKAIVTAIEEMQKRQGERCLLSSHERVLLFGKLGPVVQAMLDDAQGRQPLSRTLRGIPLLNEESMVYEKYVQNLWNIQLPAIDFDKALM